MPFELMPFTPNLKVATPVEDANHLTLRLASWNAQATVKIRDQAGRFKVGWVQVLVRQNVTATYDNNARGATSHRCECRVTCNPLPVLDSGAGEQPWYFDDAECAPEITGVNPGTVQVSPKMSDRPKDPFPWVCTHASHAPLVEVNYELSFRTWLVVRNIAPPLANNFAAVLYNFMYTIKSRLVVDTTKPVGSRANRPAGGQPGIEKYNPPLPIAPCVWKPQVANDSLHDQWLERTIFRA